MRLYKITTEADKVLVKPIRGTKYHEYDIELSPHDHIDDVIAYLEEAKKHVPEQHSISLYKNCGDYTDYGTIEIEYEEPESDSEYQARLDAWQVAIDKKADAAIKDKASRYETFLELQKEFGYK